jgi:replicative DNA helicase
MEDLINQQGSEFSDPSSGSPQTAELMPLGAIIDRMAALPRPDATHLTDAQIFGNRQPPASIEGEKGVLSGLLVDPDAFETVRFEGLKPEHFYHPNHALVFGAMVQVHDDGEPINTVTVAEALMKQHKLEQVGGPGFLAALESALPTSAHVAAYTRLVREKATLRQLIRSATQVVQSAYRQDRKVQDVVDEAEQTILAIRNESAKTGILSLHGLVQIAMKRLEALYNNKMSVVGVPSGFADLDRLTCGFQPGELVIVAARPSMGKTALTLNIATHIALNQKTPVAFFSLEMSAEQLVHRMIGAEARVDLSNLRRGTIQRHELGQFIAAAGLIGNAPLYIDETPSLSISEMRTKARRLAHQHGVQIIIVDYLQLMNGPENAENKATEVGEISKGLKAIARELKVPVIALSQLNRGVESRNDKRPMMSDLRESGAIEQDADVIAFLYREEYYSRDKTPQDKVGVTEIIIAKNRNGPTGLVELRFQSNITRFMDLDRAHEPMTYGDNF